MSVIAKEVLGKGRTDNSAGCGGGTDDKGFYGGNDKNDEWHIFNLSKV